MRRVLRRVARRLPRRRLAARPVRAPARADSGRRVRRLPVPEALHVALPPLARRRRRARAGRGVGRGHAATCRGRRGRSAARVATWVAGFDLFYALFDVDVDREQGLHSWATRFGERGAFLGARVPAPARRSCCSSRSALGPQRRRPLLDRRRLRRRAARLRALARSARRPAPARRGVLHDERRHLASRSSSSCSPTSCDRRPAASGRDGRGARRRAAGERRTRCSGPRRAGARRRTVARPAFRDVGHASRRSSARRACSSRSARRTPRSTSQPRAAGFDGLYVDANAISPATAREVAALHRPIRRRRHRRRLRRGEPGTTRLYLSGDEAPTVAALFAGSVVERARRRRRLGAQDGVRGVVEGHRRAAARDPRRRARERRLGRSAGRVARVGAGARRRGCGGGAVGGREGLALDRRDGGDRRHVRRRRRSRTASTAPPREVYRT